MISLEYMVGCSLDPRSFLPETRLFWEAASPPSSVSLFSSGDVRAAVKILNPALGLRITWFRYHRRNRRNNQRMNGERAVARGGGGGGGGGGGETSLGR